MGPTLDHSHKYIISLLRIYPIWSCFPPNLIEKMLGINFLINEIINREEDDKCRTLLNGEMRRTIWRFTIDSLVSIVFCFELVEEGWPHVNNNKKKKQREEVLGLVVGFAPLPSLLT